MMIPYMVGQSTTLKKILSRVHFITKMEHLTRVLQNPLQKLPLLKRWRKNKTLNSRSLTLRQQKKNKYGIEYGWNSTVFTTVENFWAERDFEIPELDAEESYEKIRQQILLLNPMAEEKTIRKFING